VGTNSLTDYENKIKQKARTAFIPSGFFFFLFGFLVCLNLEIQGQTKISSINFAGNKSLDESELISVMKLRKGETFIHSLLTNDFEHIVKHYAAEGWILASIDSFSIRTDTSTHLTDVTIFINEGKRAVINSLKFIGLTGVTNEEVENVCYLKKGSTFIASTLEEDIGRILNLLDKKGFPFSQLDVSDMKFTPKENEIGVDIVLKVRQGSPMIVAELRVKGNNKTNEYVIIREAQFALGEKFSGSILPRAKRSIERTQLFSTVAEPELFPIGVDSVGILFTVTEGNMNRFDGAVGYLPPAGKTLGGTITGLVDVQFRNLFGTGRRLAVRWFKQDAYSSEIELKYFEPWIFSAPVNADVGFYQRKQDTSYILNKYEFSSKLIYNEELYFGASLMKTDVIPSEMLSSAGLAKSHSLLFGISLQYDSRDDITTPQSGIVYRTEYHTGTKSLINVSGRQTSSDYNIKRLSMDLLWYITPFKRHIIASLYSLRDVRSGYLEVSDLFRFGGSTSLRGYRENQFMGSTIVWSNFEYRYLIAPTSYVFLFVDGGYYYIPEHPMSGLLYSERGKVGYGSGLRLSTALGMIGISFAFGEGDTFSTAKLHFRLINEF
jgi:outer membrane protein insertion porin family